MDPEIIKRLDAIESDLKIIFECLHELDSDIMHLNDCVSKLEDDNAKE